MHATPARLLLLATVALSLSVPGNSVQRRYAVGAFRRDSVESAPRFSSLRHHVEQHVFGSRYLPLREAVESRPRAAQLTALPRSTNSHRVPLRDAVEHRPTPDVSDAIFRSRRPSASTSRRRGAKSFAPTFAYWRTQLGERQSLKAEAKRKPASYFGSSNNNNGLSPYTVVCYVEGWAVYRKTPMSFASSQVDPFACTHLVYAFAKIDPHSFAIMPQDDEYDIVKGGYRSTVGLKRVNPALKVLISVGGWVEGGRKFSQMAGSAFNRREFIRSVLHFLDEHGFDGLDLDWEYPGAEDLGGRRTDKEHFALLVEELSEAFAPRHWLLSAAVSPSRFRLEDAYDVPRLGRNLDLINLMSFDLHAERDSSADHHAPLMQRRHDQGLSVFYNVDYAVRYWLKRGAPREKLVVGIPFYGRSFTLDNATNSYPSAPVRGLGREGRFTQEKGFLAYFEILELLEDRHWKRHTDDVGSPYAVNGDQWVGFDDPTSIATKMAYIKKAQLGGAMIWAADLDDFQGLYGPKWPLLSTVKDALLAAPSEEVQQPPLSEGIVPPLEGVAPPMEGVSPVVFDEETLNCTGQGYAPAHGSCVKYYRCEWGMKHTYLCPAGLQFDAELKLCNWPSQVGCVETGQPEQPDAPPTLEIGDGWTSNDVHQARIQDGVRQYQQEEGEELKVVCYFTNWAWYRKGEAKFVPEHADPSLCTHLVYAYAALDPETLTIMSFDPWADIENSLYQRLTGSPRLQHGDGDTKVLLSLGGWTDSAGDKYSRLVSDGTNRRAFVASVVAYLRRHNFRGLHLDWNYPKCWQSNCAKGPDSDKNNFSKLVQELKTAFDHHEPRLTLAVAVSGYKEVIDKAYDLAEIGKHVDFITAMTYDYHGAWEKRTGHVAPLYQRSGDRFPQYNTNYTLEHLISRGAPRNKLVVGVPFYGQSFTLDAVEDSGQGASASGPGDAGEFTRQPGMLAYYEICDRVRNKRWQVVRDVERATGPYAVFGDQWVGYEDPVSIAEKAAYIAGNGLAGAMAWTVDLDDFTNRCCVEPFPLLRALNRGLGRLHDSTPQGGDCTKPPAPVTPVPPQLTTGVDSGASTSTTPHDHHHEETRPTAPTTQPTPPESSTWWQQPTTQSTTTEVPWWATTSTTTPKPTTTTAPWWEQTRPPPTEAPVTPASTTTTTTTPPPPPPPPTAAPLPVPPPGGSCQPGEYLPDPGNCNAYYRCILGELRKQFCAPGLHYNAAIRVCDWPAEAKCGQPGHLPPQAEPIPTAPWWEVQTTSTTQEPSTTQQTWWPQNPTTESETQQTWWSQQTWWQPDPTTTTTTTTNRPWVQPVQDLVVHPMDSPCISGKYYPVAGDCSAFAMCVNGNLVNSRCASGLVWNSVNDRCDWPYNFQCRDSPSVTKQRLKLKTTVAEVDSACDEGSYSPHPTDCNQYLFCLWKKFQAFSCANGLHWNVNQRTCDWPVNAQCQPGVPSADVPVAPNPVPTKKPLPDHRPPPVKPKPPMKPVDTKPVATKPVAPKPKPPPQADVIYDKPGSDYFKVVCYFTNWAWYRQGKGKYVPEDIDSSLCTHVVYGFAVLDYENLIIKAHDSWADFDNKFYERVVALRRKGVKVSLALGGWNDSLGDKYSRLVNSPSARRRFINHALDFITKHNFDGLDLDWEYPKCWQVDCEKGPASDKSAFAALLRELHAEFAPRGLLLSAAVSPSKTVIDAGYDVQVLGETLDWVAVMTYDYHGQWDKKTGHLAPMYFHPDDDFYFFNANYSINYWISEGVPARKIVMGMPLYGQSFQLSQASTNGLNANAPGPGQAGEFTRAAGFLAYYEICDRIKNRGWTVVTDDENRMGPYAFHGNQWVSFDDADMIRLKSEYVREMGLGGGMVWALDLDDFRDSCGEGKHPLLSVIRSVLARPLGVGDSVKPERPPPPPPQQPEVVPEVPERPTQRPDHETDHNTEPQHGQQPDQHLDLSTTGVVQGTTQKPLHSATESTGAVGDFKVVCYFTNWAWYRQGGGKYLPSDIDPDLCTHIIYGFAVLNGDSLQIKPHDSWADFDNKFYEKVTAFKARGIKVLVAIGGWNDSAGDKYSRLANSPAARARFITHVTQFITDNNFDGLDLDWEYPKCWQVDCKKGPDSDKEAFSALVRELRVAFQPLGYLLSAAVSPSKVVVDAGYDVTSLAADLDWIAVMCYDYHGQWDKITGHVAPMYVHPEDVDVTFNSNFTIAYWMQLGAPAHKLVMGMPMYGQSFSLADNSKHGLNAPTYGGGEAGEATRARGFLSYYEICHRIQKQGWQVVKDPEGRIGPYAYLRDQWVSFDDVAMIRYKSEFVRRLGLGGGMIWALDLDDFKNDCGCEKYPLLKTINRVLRGYPGPAPSCELTGNSLKLELPDRAQTPDFVGALAPGATPDACASGAYIAHPSDCNKYYVCQFGQLAIQSCPASLHWTKDHCDWPENARCSALGDAIIPAEVPSVVTVPTPAPAPTTVATTQATTQAPAHWPTVAPPSDTGYKVVCYFTNWAWYRQGEGKYTPDDIDASLCTHIAYGFAVLDGSTLTAKPHDSWADLDNEFYRKVVDLKRKGIKVVLALGGWNDSLGDKYSRLVNSPAARAKFVAHIMAFVEKHGFDGLDLDWEYPKCWQVDCNLGPDSDKQGFASLVRELSEAFRPRGLLLSSAVSPSKVVIDSGYDVPALARYFDWISVMTYDFHGHWDKQTGHVAPLYYVPGDTYDYFNANFSIRYWLDAGAPASKIVMGMPMYGQSFTLRDSDTKGVNSQASGPGQAGEFTRAAGFLAYYEICHNVKTKGWSVVRDPEARIGPYAVKGDQWASYDDVEDIRRKSRFVKQLGLGGGMIWALDLDDFRGRCGCGKHPLLRTINHELRGIGSADTRDCT